MLELSAQAQTRGKFLGKGRNVILRARMQLPKVEPQGREIPIASVVQAMLEAAPDMLPPAHATELRQEGDKVICTLKDLRGRPAEAFKDSGVLNPHRDSKVREEEFFYTDGSIFDLPATLVEAEAGPGAGSPQGWPQTPELEKISFHYHLLTKFNRFTDDGHILHDLRSETTANLNPLLPLLSPKMMIKLVPMHLEQVRLGFEGYKQQFFGAMLGLIPKLQSRFYFEVSTSHIQLVLEEEGLADGKILPFEDSGLLSGLEHGLALLGLLPDLRKQLKDQVSRK